jgi:hypothetical protein
MIAHGGAQRAHLYAAGERQRLREAGALVGRNNGAFSGPVGDGERGLGKTRVWDRCGLGGLRVGRSIGAAAHSPPHSSCMCSFWADDALMCNSLWDHRSQKSLDIMELPTFIGNLLSCLFSYNV